MLVDGGCQRGSLCCTHIAKPRSLALRRWYTATMNCGSCLILSKNCARVRLNCMPVLADFSPRSKIRCQLQPTYVWVMMLCSICSFRYVQATHVLHTGGLGAARSGGRVLTSPAHHLLSGVLSALGLWVCYCSFLFWCWGAPWGAALAGPKDALSCQSPLPMHPFFFVSGGWLPASVLLPPFFFPGPCLALGTSPEGSGALPVFFLVACQLGQRPLFSFWAVTDRSPVGHFLRISLLC